MVVVVMVEMEEGCHGGGGDDGRCVGGSRWLRLDDKGWWGGRW